MACGKLEHAFYVVASTTQIVRVVHVKCNKHDISIYIKALKSMIEVANMEWLENENVPLPTYADHLFKDELKHAVDNDTVKKNLQLWRALNKFVVTEGRPVPPGRLILPTVVAYWNRCKGSIDLYSRHLKDVQAKHNKLNATGRIWIRLLMTCIFNAYQSYAMYKTMSGLANGDFLSFYNYQLEKRERAGPLSTFCSILSDSLKLRTEGDIFRTETNVEVENVILRKQYYRKKFFTNTTWINQRMDPNCVHASTSMYSMRSNSQRAQKNCVWCCCFDHQDLSCRSKRYIQKNGTCKRRGFKTRSYCSSCKVPLCTVERYDGRSCFDLWHESTELNNPCDPMAIATRKRKQRTDEAQEDVQEEFPSDTDEAETGGERNDMLGGKLSDAVLSDSDESETTVVFSPRKLRPRI